jgi:hypothetical protein
MLSRLVGSSVLAATFVLMPVLAQGPDKKKGPAEPGAPRDSDTLRAGEFTGKVKSVPGSDRLFTVEVVHRFLVPTAPAARPAASNPGVSAALRDSAARAEAIYGQIRAATAQAARARTPQQRRAIVQHLVGLNNQLLAAVANFYRTAGAAAALSRPPAGFRVQEVRTDVEFQAREDVKVRTLILPEPFDDKGNRKKYTKKELDELRGKEKGLPGFESALEQLEVGQVVRVTLGPAPKRKPVAKGKDENKDLDKEPDKEEKEPAPPGKRMQVRLIVITVTADGETGRRR